MSWYLLQGAVEEGLIYALVALGLLVSYGILNIADMTTDGSFVLGAAIASTLTINQQPAMALIVAVCGGILAGLVTALLQTLLGIPSILSGIITMTALYSVNLMVMGGRGNLFFSGEETLFTVTTRFFGETLGVLIPLLVLIVIASLLLIWFFSTRIGLSVRATGDNPAMVQASSINPRFTITIGLCISNGLVALAGALWAQKTGQGDISLGTGVVVIGLASLVLGRLVFRKNNMTFRVIGAIFGAIIYRIIFTLALRYTSNAGYLKFVSAVILTVIMAYPKVKVSIQQFYHRKKEERAYVGAKKHNQDIL